MNVTMYEVREDEQAAIARCAIELGMTVRMHAGTLDLDSVSLAEGSEAVSILGGSRLDEELFIKLKAAGIRYVSTRTVGFNHIDVPLPIAMGSWCAMPVIRHTAWRNSPSCSC